MRLAMGIEYDGAGFQGWQRQRHGPSVQQILEQAIASVADHEVSVVASGRTDSGVHALGQVVHVDVHSERSMHQWLLGVNHHCPEVISVRWVQRVDETFHARFSAQQRRYVYLIYPRAAPSGLRHGRVLRVHQALDMNAMQQAARYLVGEHDFSAFRSSQCQSKSPIRHVSHTEIVWCGDCLVVDIAANAFLHHMVRNVVGSLLKVGYGERDPSWLGEVLRSCNRACAAEKVSAAGLYLLEVLYPCRYGLPKPDLTYMGLDLSALALRHEALGLASE